jgi:hypothetical protein
LFIIIFSEELGLLVDVCESEQAVDLLNEVFSFGDLKFVVCHSMLSSCVD